MMYQIAVCDDDNTDIAYITALVYQWAKESGCVVELDSFLSAESFLFCYEEKKDYEILLLDIEMGKKNGIELARQIREENNRIQIIFVTGFPDFALEGYEVAALHYLIKPVEQEKLYQVLDRAVQNLSKTELKLLFVTDGEKLGVLAREILMVEAFAHSVEITTEKEHFRISMSISEVEEYLGDGFVRCHRSYIVGLAHIRRMVRNMVILDNGMEVPLSRGSYQTVNQAFIKYYKSEE